MNLYHVTKFFPYFSFTVYCFYTKISSFMPVLSVRIVVDSFFLLIFYSEKFSTHVCRLPYSANVNLNLSNNSWYARAYPRVKKDLVMATIFCQSLSPSLCRGSTPFSISTCGPSTTIIPCRRQPAAIRRSFFSFVWETMETKTPHRRLGRILGDPGAVNNN